MRDTIDFGIDLGTTNSALAVLDGGQVSVVKNNLQGDYTPSAVWLPKAGVVQVGAAAKSRRERDPDNVQIEFKQAMGYVDARRTFARAGVSMTPVELSAEVLKSLRGDAARRFGEPPEAAVITVPAAFALNQTEATSEAAKLAGFSSRCPLVQEPTAAAFAYGFQNESRGAYWMVFDFGGGTFDSAVVSTVEGELSVLHHAGDTGLGGKNIDAAIVSSLLGPAAAKEFGLTNLAADDPRMVRITAVLRAAAESAKIALSSTEQAQIMTELDLGGGAPETFEYTLQRADVDRLAMPFYLRAVHLCREALANANLRPSDIDRLLLVGGPTLAPGLRELLADPSDGLGIELDHSQDPSTVVARGAAIYAGTVALPRAKVVPKRGEFSGVLSYPVTTSLTTVPVSGRFETPGGADWSRFRVALSDSRRQPAYRSAEVALTAGGAFTLDVLLQERQANRFDVELIDPAGAHVPVNPAGFTTTHVVNEMQGQAVVNSMGLTEADGTFTPMLMKNRPLPAQATQSFFTTASVHRTDSGSVIRIPIAEGEFRRGERNKQVGLIEIKAQDVRRDLPRGSEVVVTFEMDQSRLVSIIADVPLLGEQFDAEVDLSHTPVPDVPALRRQLNELEARHEQLRSEIETTRSDRARGLLARLDEKGTVAAVRAEVTSSTNDEGAAVAADERIRSVQAELDDIEEELRIPDVMARLRDQIEHCRELVESVGSAEDRTELADIERRYETVRDTRDVAAAERLSDRATDLQVLLLRRDGRLDEEIFHALRMSQDRMTDPARARELVREGDHALNSRNWPALNDVNRRLRALLPPDQQGSGFDGIQRGEK
ncbi:Hsp70 family protein [Amycolatopsis rhabdoformis]|uniref:Hsp70 family protein n=1 Tax=Amycolatopsis rhabdoformis TaxID=1448059 RepID=A0ABZ1I0C9_9PSEU|nr:Hsp70 family protein [Amycolatopsis rhabdoformis]WSE27085.1 Hsp70 family protein [Amycolatopsis rhabdoformis]